MRVACTSRLLALLPCLIVLACRSKPQDRPIEVHLHYGAAPLEVDADDVRLVTSIEQTEAVLGHRVEFEFDLVLAPDDHNWFLERMFDSEVGRIPRELRELAAEDPEVFAYARERIRTFTFRYDGAATNDGPTFDPGTGRLIYEVPSPYLGRGSLAPALRREYLDAYDATFRGRRLADVPDSQLHAYAEWSVDRRRTPNEDPLSRASQYLDVYRRAAARRAAHEDVLAVLRGEIPKQIYYLSDQSRNRAEGRDVSPLFDRVAKAYGQFVVAEFDRLDAKQKAAVLAYLFPRRTDVRGRSSDRFIRDAYPGFDRLGFGLRIARRWLRAGAPDELAQNELTQLICPRGTPSKPLENPRCRSGDTLWAFAVYDATERGRVAAALLKANDVRLTFAALTAMHDLYPEGMEDVLGRLAGNRRQHAVGLAIKAGR